MTTQGTGTEKSRIMTGLFTDKESSEGAYKSLRDRGYADDDINVVMSDETRNKYYANDADSELGSKAAEGTGIGGAIGGTLGAIIGGVAAIGTNLVLPGLGLVVWGADRGGFGRCGSGRIDRRTCWRADRLGHSGRSSQGI
ncbi:MAG: hypothetical protein ACKVRN_10135 [Pyrinomonadaceae bacterium]